MIEVLWSHSRWRCDRTTLVICLVAETVMLTISYTYDQRRLDGPPFAVPQQEVQSLCDGLFQAEMLLRESTYDIPPRFRAAGLTDVSEEVYRLVRL